MIQNSFWLAVLFYMYVPAYILLVSIVLIILGGIASDELNDLESGEPD